MPTNTRAEVQMRSFKSKKQDVCFLHQRTIVPLFSVCCMHWWLLSTSCQCPTSSVPIAHLLQTLIDKAFNRKQLICEGSLHKGPAAAFSAGPGETPRTTALLLGSSWAMVLYDHTSKCMICSYWLYFIMYNMPPNYHDWVEDVPRVCLCLSDTLPADHLQQLSNSSAVQGLGAQAITSQQGSLLSRVNLLFCVCRDQLGALGPPGN